VAEENRDSEASASRGEEGAGGQEGDVLDSSLGAEPEAVADFPRQSPLFHAQQADRYERQVLIRQYEATYGCRLAVMSDVIFPASVTLFEELVYNAERNEDLHLILDSPGGDGETAIRLARQAQKRCREFVVIVPDQAKSAATVLTMGAHRILMGPMSDLGPIDPQFQLPDGGGLVAAKDIIAAVEAAELAVQERPETYPLHASLLSNVTALMVQQARSALKRTDQIALEALTSNPTRDEVAARDLWGKLEGPLSIEAMDHGSVFDAEDALAAGLPVEILDPGGAQWQSIWRLWTKYVVLGCRVYEGRLSSQADPWPTGI
jgi:hypothetical protein